MKPCQNKILQIFWIDTQLHETILNCIHFKTIQIGDGIVIRRSNKSPKIRWRRDNYITLWFKVSSFPVDSLKDFFM
jgi:hypothetical protein